MADVLLVSVSEPGLGDVLTEEVRLSGSLVDLSIS